MTLRNIPRRQLLPPLPPTAHVVHRCRVCDFIETGWCAVEDPRVVVGLCLDCYGASEGAKAPRVLAKDGGWVPR